MYEARCARGLEVYRVSKVCFSDIVCVPLRNDWVSNTVKRTHLLRGPVLDVTHVPTVGECVGG